VDAAQSPTVQAVASELGAEPEVSAQRVIEAILARHTHDYPVRVVHWPDRARLASVDRWLTEARELLTTPAHPQLHGRAIILGLALADPVAGREIVRSGLFEALTAQLPSRFVEGLTPLGLERLEAIPLLGAMAGAAVGVVTLPGRIWDVAFSPNGQLILVGTDRGWTLLTRSYRREIRSAETDSPVVRVGFSLDGRELIVGYGERFEYVPLRDRGPRLVGADAEPLAIARGIAVGQHYVEVDGRSANAFRPMVNAVIAAEARVVAAADAAGGVLVWNAADGSVVGEITERGPLDLALSADGRTLVTRGEERIALWDVGSGRQYWSVAGEGRAAVALSPDGTRVAAAGTRGWLIDAASGRGVESLADDVTCVVFSVDGSRLAMGCGDGSVWIGNPETGAAIAQLAQASRVTALLYAQDGEQLLTGTEAGTLSASAGGFEPPPRRRLAAYSADDTRAATDLSKWLEIDPDVDALAALLAARAVEPPLSVGLFGDWGSGKSFFMRRLQARVAELASDARDSGQLQKEVAWHKRIVQIEFNAWHYAEGNLWASLVEHILANLRLSEDEDDDLVAKRRREVEKRITTQQAVTAQARDAAELTLADVTREREALGEELAALDAEDPLREVAAPELLEAVKSAVVTPLAGPTFEQLGAAIEDTRTVLRRGGEVLAPLAHAKHKWRRLAALIVVLVAAPVVAWIVSKFASEVDTFAGVVALLGGAAAWVQRQMAWTQARLDDLQVAAAKLDEPVREARERREAAIREKQLAYEAAARRAEEEAARLASLEHELKVTTPSRLLARLIADRVESDDYRRHLGVLALVRRDFEAMSDYLRIDAREIDACDTLAQEEADDEVRLGRIVLYVDDLDRCEPDQVVAVLQAVHLLLAFPLFTVVVGVDMRWVERALRLHHKTLLDSGGAEPRDYLEKIFQIPFWLEPLDADASRSMLRGILGSAAPLPQTDGATMPAPTAGTSPSELTETTAVGEGVPSPEAPAEPVAPSRRAIPLPVAPPRDLYPRSLEVGDVELAAMDELAPLLGRSPRALKRFVNTYRLIKVRAQDPAVFLREDEPIAQYRATLLLLALATGVPNLAGPFLDKVVDGREGVVEDHLDVALPWPGIELRALRPAAIEVVRFTFHWHGAAMPAKA
jgi:hypothetical protein